MFALLWYLSIDVQVKFKMELVDQFFTFVESNFYRV